MTGCTKRWAVCTPWPGSPPTRRRRRDHDHHERGGYGRPGGMRAVSSGQANNLRPRLASEVKRPTREQYEATVEVRKRAAAARSRAYEGGLDLPAMVDEFKAGASYMQIAVKHGTSASTV